MASRETQEFQVNSARDALELLSRLVYEQFGEQALPLIREAWYKLGASRGKKMKETMSACGLEAAGEAFVAGVRKRDPRVELLEVSDETLHIRGYECPLGLANTDRKLCEAMMALDKGIFESASGEELNLNIHKTVAAGDPYCETVFTTAK